MRDDFKEDAPKAPRKNPGGFFFAPQVRLPLKDFVEGRRRETMENRKVRILVEGAMSAALALALSYVRLWRMPQGGSITLENVPLFLFALRWGLKAGLGAGSVAGFLQLILGGYVVHPLQGLLDYPLAFASLALTALWRKPLWGGLALGTLARLFCHVLSGVIFFAAYAPKGTNVWLYSTVYNASFMVPSLILSTIAIYIIWPRISKMV